MTQIPTSFLNCFFDNEAINYFHQQSKLNANIKDDFVYHVFAEYFRTFFVILVIPGYASLPRRCMYWEQKL